MRSALFDREEADTLSRVLPTARLLTLVSALAVLLCGCAGTRAYHCSHLPGIPKVGAAGGVQVMPLPDIGGYRVHFQGRDWQVNRVAASPTPFVAQVVVVSASPFPELRVTPSVGRPLTFPLLPIACVLPLAAVDKPLRTDGSRHHSLPR